jgi:hypothetical protein
MSLREKQALWTLIWEVATMQWDLGVGGLGVLVAMSVGFGVVAELVMWRSTSHWLLLIASTTFFVAGLLTSEFWFGWATQEELQPNIDGLSFDEVLLFGLLAGVASVFATWYLGRRRNRTLQP